MAYVPTQYRDGDRSTPLSAANLNKTEQGVKQAHDRLDVLEARPSGSGVSEDRVVELAAAEVAKIPGWFHSTGNTPVAELSDKPEGSYCYTQGSGRVYRMESGRWVYKGFNTQAVLDNGVAEQVSSGELTRSALDSWLSDKDLGSGTGGVSEDRVREIVSEVPFRVVESVEAAAGLPDGTVFVVVPKGSPEVVSVTAFSVNAREHVVDAPDLLPGDFVVLGVNVKGASDVSVAPPEGFETLVDRYYVGTQISYVFAGQFTGEVKLVGSSELEFSYVAVGFRGAAGARAGSVKHRALAPAESTTVTAPAVDFVDGEVCLAFAFERTSALESAAQVRVSDGWSKMAFASQTVNYQTVLCAQAQRLGVGDCVVEYPNSQQANGAGVQVVVYGV